MTSPIDKPDWKLGLYIRWEPTRHPKSEECPRCHGHGTIGGGPLYMGDPEDCPDCYGGSKWLPFKELSEEPKVPPLLVEHMIKAWEEYFEPFPKKNV